MKLPDNIYTVLKWITLIVIPALSAAYTGLAAVFGVRVLEHSKCGLTYQNMDAYDPDELHPNKYGHSLIANNDIRQMDGGCVVRYSIA